MKNKIQRLFIADRLRFFGTENTEFHTASSYRIDINSAAVIRECDLNPPRHFTEPQPDQAALRFSKQPASLCGFNSVNDCISKQVQ